ncbi:Protein trichome birefringence-like 19 [Bienertia sinuspersici]
MDTSIPKNQRFKFNLKLVLQIIFPLILLTIIPLQLAKNISSYRRSQKPITTTPNSYINIKNQNDDTKAPPIKHGSLPPTTRKCDIFSGEWVPNPEAPYYTNTSCWAIHEHQNCMKYGRPDSEFMKWRWKPDECELPLFNPRQFFEIMRGKSLAFVGDSVARNQMQSLICLLSRVEYPYDVSYTDDERFKRWHYNNYNFTVAILTTPFLVKSQENDPNGPTGTGIFGLFLDEADEAWKNKIDEFDFIVVSAGHWFFRPLMYYENQSLIGCRFCQIPNVTDYTMAYGYKKAFRTVFQTILERENFKGVAYLRTYAPSHFEGGEWNKGGNCLRKKPFKSSQINLQGVDLDLYMAQLSEFKKAQKLGLERGMRFRLIDLTQTILMRPDGHPSRYGHWPDEKVTLYNDCVHWCLPGPIDTWNDFLLEMLRTEGVKSKEDMMALHSSERKLKSRQ